MARQPIFDAADTVFGYELLYRRRAQDAAALGGDASQMSSDVIVQSFLELGLDRLTGGKRGFVNFGRDMLLRRAYGVLAPEMVVIELLEDVEIDATVDAACREMVAAGYTLALDDYVPGSTHDSLLDVASIVKVDVLGRPLDEIAAIAAGLRPHGVQLLAERVQTSEVLRAARTAGFGLFQGHYFSRPETVAHSGTSVEVLRLLPLLNTLLDDEVSDSRIEEQFRRDPVLSHKLLQIVNSAGYGGRGISSILHAIRMVGRQTLHRWLALLLVSSLASSGEPSRELVRVTLARARLLELLAAEARADLGALFLIGMFSSMDVLLQLPMPELLQRIDFAPEVRDALLRTPGSPLFGWLEMAEAYEAGRWEVVTLTAAGLGIEPAGMPDLYVQALQWASDTFEPQEA